MSRRSSPPSSEVRPQQGIAADDMAAAWAMHNTGTMSGVDPAMAYAGSYAGAYGLPADTQASTSSGHSGGNRGRDLDESNVYVARLPSNFTLEKFHELMSRYGTVMSARLLEGDRWQNKGVKGVGFARMSRPDEAAKAIEALNALRLPGAADNLQARYAYKKTKDQPSTAVMPAYPESMPWLDPATTMAAMQWAAYGMAGYGAGQPGAYSHHAAGADGASVAAAAAGAGQSHHAADYAAWMAQQMAYYYPYGEYYNAAGGSAMTGVQANPSIPSGQDGGPDGSSGRNPVGQDGGRDGASGSLNPFGQDGGRDGASGSRNPSGRDGRLDSSSGSRNPSGRNGGPDGPSGSRSKRHAVGSEAAGSRRDNVRRSSPSPDRRDTKKPRRSDEPRRTDEPRRSDESRRCHRSRSTSADKAYRLARGSSSSRRDRKPERDDGKSSKGRSSRRDPKEGASSSSKTGSPSSANNTASRKSTAESKGTVHPKPEPESGMTSTVEPKTKPINKQGGAGNDAGLPCFFD